MSLLYWLFLILLTVALRAFGEHSFIMVFVSPLVEAVWIAFPLFVVLSLLNGWEKKNKIGRFLGWSVRLVLSLLMIALIIVFNYGWLPFFVAGSAIVLLLFFIRKKISLTFSVIGLMIGIVIFLSSYGHLLINSFRYTKTDKNAITIISYNLYAKNSRDKIEYLSEIIKKYNPQVICLQEVNSGDKKLFPKAFSDDYPYQLYPNERGNRYQGGIVLSKYPFVTARNIVIYNRFKDSNLSMNFVKIKTPDEKVFSLYNLHLISNGFAIRSSFSTRKLRNGVVEQERINYIKRLDEAKNVAAKIDLSDKRIVLAGDFNDTMNSKVLSYFEKNFKNAWYLAGRKQHATFGYRYIAKIYDFLGIPGKYAFNLVGIDHVFVNDGVEVIKYTVPDERFSDHSPVLTKIVLKK